VILFFINEQGEKFGLGVGGEMSTIILVRDEDHFFYSIGDPNRDDTAVFLCPAYTEMSAKQLIPHDQAREALRTWFSGQDISSVVTLTDILP
jgi:hypothetical protein